MKTKTEIFHGVIALLVLCGLLMPALTVKANWKAENNPIPVLAYYYIWFDSNSWERAKTDYPVLGKYTSDDRAVMVQHIRWAKAAGIKGFIVSWKSTDTLNRRLKQLVEVADAEDFKLVIIYQGLDFNRDPLQVSRIASDMDEFIRLYADHPSFQLFSKPLIIWSGTWKFSVEDIASVTETRRNSLLFLASEKNLAGYNRIAKFVDGDAYYWSSVNPDTFPGYKDKLVGLSDQVHKNGGIWIPPAAPGFDARLVGGTSIVDRKDGETLRTQINTALTSSPDALGIISWNEFSENSQIEPSEQYGTQSLNIITEMNKLPAVQISDFDSSEPAGVFPEGFTGSRIAAIGGLAVLVIVGFVSLALRQSSVVENK